jgi:hypothetical protein
MGELIVQVEGKEIEAWACEKQGGIGESRARNTR